MNPDPKQPNPSKPAPARPNARQVLWSVVTWVIFWGIYGLLRGGIDLLAGLEPIQLVFATLSGMAAGAVFGAIFGFFGLTGDNPSMDLMMPKLPGVVLGGLGLGLVAYNLKWTALVGPAIVVGMFAGAWLWDKSFPKRRPANPTSPAEAEKKEKREKK